jgi:hypothetical protein
MTRLLKKFRAMILARRDPARFARSIGVQVGSSSRLIDISAKTFGSEPYLVKLGDHVTVTSGVRFITHDGGVWVFRQEEPDLEVLAPISVGSNVFIGVNTILLPGAQVGSDVVIAAGSVVTGAIPSGVVAGGVPAKLIKSIEEYRRSVSTQASNTRGLSFERKRRVMEQRFSTENES